MSPGNAYVAGEKGPEPIFATSHASVMSAALAKRYFGGGGGPMISYMVDARGTDPVLSDMNTRRALHAVHGSAVATGVLANHDRQRRVPSVGKN
ncbi:MAG: hypothetical protein LAQ69_22425 [Acidobacteriia bacterium]|nr:hypothetical protein [Terriglobia bacterium]